MKVLLVNGSPHEKGCTYTALQELADTFAKENIETDAFWVGNKPLYSCVDCGKCGALGRCVFEDRVNDFLAIAGDYDGFIFASRYTTPAPPEPSPPSWAGPFSPICTPGKTASI